MENLDESIAEIKRFLKKLDYIISNDATLSVFGNKFVEKNKIDDIWVCVEATFPEEYKKILKNPNNKHYRSIPLYYQLKKALHEKSKMLSSCYSIKYADVSSIMKGFLTICEQDIRLLYQSL